MPTAQHRRFDGGFEQDSAAFLLDEGVAWSAINMLMDRIGITRKRGGISGLGATTTYNGDNIGALLKDDGSQQLYAMGSSSGVRQAAAVSSLTGTFSGAGNIFGDTLTDGGRPFQHYGFLIYPTYGNTPGAAILPVSAIGFAGALPTQSYSFTAPNSVVMTAGDKRITCAAADDPTTRFPVGSILHLQYGSAFQNYYVGRVTRLVSTTAFEVYPTPVSGNAGAASGCSIVARGYGAGINAIPFPGQFVPHYFGSKVGMSFQGRVVLGNLSIYNAGGFARIEVNPRGVAFSTVLLEQPLVPVVSIPPNEMTGATWLMNDGYPALNTFNIPAQEAITAMSPTGFGDAVIFSAFRCFRLTGNLSTQYGTTQSITWAVREIPNSVGCMSERSMQRTPRGIIFAHDSGVYSTDGNSMKPLMYKRISDYWKSLLGPNFKIYGCALLHGNHYYICGMSGAGGVLWGLMLNLDTLRWTILSGKNNTPASWIINSAVVDSIDPSRCWGLKWWDQSLAAPSMTGGQLLRLDQMFAPSAANRADSDGTQVSFNYFTKSFTENSPTLQKVWKQATIEYKNIGGAGVKITPIAALDGVDIINAGGPLLQLPQQDVYTITAATNASPIVITTSATHGITVDSWLQVTGVTGNTAANGPWRVQAVTATTITLMGSVGNGAYISGGTVQALDTKDFDLGANMAQGVQRNNAGISYKFQDQGTLGADEFEIWGITHSWDDREAHYE